LMARKTGLVRMISPMEEKRTTSIFFISTKAYLFPMAGLKRGITQLQPSLISLHSQLLFGRPRDHNHRFIIPLNTRNPSQDFDKHRTSRTWVVYFNDSTLGHIIMKSV